MNNFLEHVPVLLDEILENLKKFEIKYDNEGRINIPESLLSYANIDEMAVFTGIGKSFMIWSDFEYEKEYQNTQKILQSSGPPKLILNKKAGISNE